MKRLVGVLVAVAILCAGLLLGGTQAFAQNYAIVTTKMMPKKKYYATEFGCRMGDSVIVYYERPENGRIFQNKNDLKISTNIGSVKFDSDRKVFIDLEKKGKSFFFVYTPQNSISIDGYFIIRDKRNKIIVHPGIDYKFIDFEPSGTMITVRSLGNKKPLSLDQKDVTITTVSGATISVDQNEIYFKKKNYILTFKFDPSREEAYCFVH